jgi:hypothetical protein
MTSSKTDYRNSVFPCPSPPKCSAILSYKEVKDLYKLIKRNAASVRSTLGGGNHGLLALTLPAIEYNAIAGTQPFIRPIAPVPPRYPQGMDAAEAIRRQNKHDHDVAKFHEINDVEKLLLQQILDSIGHQYLDLFTNEYTGQLNGDIAAIFEYIFDNYAKASQEDVEAQYEVVRTLTYDLRDPLVTLYTPIDDLQKVAVAAENPFTDTQLVKLALNVLQSTGDFEETIIAWNARLFPARTWTAFKPIFDARRNALAKARGKTMQSAGLQQANILAEALQHNIHGMESTILDRLNALEAPVPENLQDENIPPQEQAGSATTDVTADILQALKNLTANYKKLENKFANMSDTPRGRLRDITNTSDRRERRPRTIVTKYCWTHGGCGHTSTDCKNPGTGHKRDATFTTKKGGSTEYCNEA